MLKKMLVIALAAAMAVCTVGCSCNGTTEENTSTVSANENVKVKDLKIGEPEETTEAATEKATTAKEKAVKNAGLKVDKKGNIVDEKGNKVKADKDGNITVKTDDGKTVKVSVDEVKEVNNNSNSNTSSKPTNNSNNNSNNTSSKPSNNNNNNNSSKPNTGNNNNSSSKPSTGNNNSSKVWHEAEYEYINHPAETKQVWVVDKAAYTYEEPVYEEHDRTICNTCGADITENVAAHGKTHMHCGENFSYHNEWVEVQVGTNTVTVPEEGHYETQVVKEAWTEKKLVKEAGYY